MGPQLHQREDSLPSSFPSIKPYQRQHNMLRLAALFLLVSAWCLTSEAGVTAQCNREWQKNTDFNGDDLGKIKAEGPIQCEEACTKNPKCQFFTFVQKRKDCYPKASKSGQPGRVLKNPICISGFSLKGCVVPDCHFPFIYKGKQYDSCTTVDNSGSSWCSTTYNYQGQWRTCTDKDLRVKLKVWLYKKGQYILMDQRWTEDLNSLPSTTLAPEAEDSVSDENEPASAMEDAGKRPVIKTGDCADWKDMENCLQGARDMHMHPRSARAMCRNIGLSCDKKMSGGNPMGYSYAGSNPAYSANRGNPMGYSFAGSNAAYSANRGNPMGYSYTG